MKTFTQFVIENRGNCDLITFRDIQELEKEFDKKFAQFDIDFRFTRHFADRASDSRNKPCITIEELKNLFNRIYMNRKQGRKIFSQWSDMEVVLKDVRNNVNIPFAIEYDKDNDEFDVIAKTIMRKKNFKTTGPSIKV